MTTTRKNSGEGADDSLFLSLNDVKESDYYDDVLTYDYINKICVVYDYTNRWGTTSREIYYIVSYSDERIAFYHDESSNDIHLLSSDNQVVFCKKYTCNDLTKENSQYEDMKITDSKISNYSVIGKNSCEKVDIYLNDTYVFDSLESAKLYLDTGIVNNVYKSVSEIYDSDSIYFSSFDMIIHDSNNLDNFYIDFKWILSSYLIDNIDNAYVKISFDVDVDLDMIASLVNADDVFPEIHGEYDIPLSMYHDSYRMVFDRNLFTSEVCPDYAWSWLKNALLGDELWIDLDSLSIGDIGGNTLAEIVKSKMYITFTPYVDYCFGQKNECIVDFLAPDSSYTSSSICDSNGVYTSNGDYQTVDGYYYTDVQVDNYGNNTYNYYYISGNDWQEIDDNGNDTGGVGSAGNVIQNNSVTIPDTINVNLNSSSSSSSDNVVIEDDDYSLQSITNLIDGAGGFFDDLDTEKNDDGFLALLSGFFGSVDNDLGYALGAGMGSTIIICILRSLLKR